MLQVAINSRHQDALNRARTAARQATGCLRQTPRLNSWPWTYAFANAVGEIGQNHYGFGIPSSARFASGNDLGRGQLQILVTNDEWLMEGPSGIILIVIVMLILNFYF